MIFDRYGALYFTDPGLGPKDAPGRVFRWTPEGQLTLLVQGLLYPNGIALTADEDTLFVTETGSNRVSCFTIEPDGSLGEGSVFHQFEGGEGPDGMALDAGGNLYVTHRGTGAVVVLDPKGHLIARLLTGGSTPSNVAFWGESLYVTEDETAAVYRLDIGVRGLPLFHQK